MLAILLIGAIVLMIVGAIVWLMGCDPWPL